jgi:hypothetical protein
MLEQTVHRKPSLEDILKLTVFCVLCICAIWYIPKIEKNLFPSNVKPGSITLLGVGLVMTLFTGAIIYFGIRSYLDLPKQFFLFAFLYNAVIVVIKFTLSPLLIYDLSVVNSDINNSELTFTIVAAFVFLLYFVVFFGIYLFFRSKVRNSIKVDDSKLHKAIVIFGLTLLGGAIILAGAFPVILVFFSLSYFFGIVSTISGALIAFSLLGAILFLRGAFRSVVERTIAVRDVTYLVSFFWIGVSFLLVYHALWVVYVLVLVALWPLRVVSPK